jgi:hypothetical protein
MLRGSDTANAAIAAVLCFIPCVPRSCGDDAEKQRTLPKCNVGQHLAQQPLEPFRQMKIFERSGKESGHCA